MPWAKQLATPRVLLDVDLAADEPLVQDLLGAAAVEVEAARSPATDQCDGADHGQAPDDQREDAREEPAAGAHHPVLAPGSHRRSPRFSICACFHPRIGGRPGPRAVGPGSAGPL